MVLLRLTRIYFIFSNILEPPTLEEGFKEIVRVNVVPRFENEERKKLYNMYLLER